MNLLAHGRGRHAELLGRNPAYAHLVNAYETDAPAAPEGPGAACAEEVVP